MSKVCCVNGCNNKVRGLGYCNRHYLRFKRHGDPLGGRETMNGAPMQFIYDVALAYAGNDCLKWPFYIRADGRGQVRFRGRDQLSSRVVCILAHGEPPSPSYEAAHSCGKGHLGCVNPKHLRWATMMENELDKFIHGTTPSGSKNGMAKLTESQVNEISILSTSGNRLALAIRYGVSERTIRRVANGNIWPAAMRNAS